LLFSNCHVRDLMRRSEFDNTVTSRRTVLTLSMSTTQQAFFLKKKLMVEIGLTDLLVAV
jgi:hypothetical protein